MVIRMRISLVLLFSVFVTYMLTHIGIVLPTSAEPYEFTLLETIIVFILMLVVSYLITSQG